MLSSINEDPNQRFLRNEEGAGSRLIGSRSMSFPFHGVTECLGGHQGALSRQRSSELPDMVMATPGPKMHLN
jgi:hypothetical protein